MGTILGTILACFGRAKSSSAFDEFQSRLTCELWILEAYLRRLIRSYFSIELVGFVARSRASWNRAISPLDATTPDEQRVLEKSGNGPAGAGSPVVSSSRASSAAARRA